MYPLLHNVPSLKVEACQKIQAAQQTQLIFMSKQVLLRKINSILQKNENRPKKQYTPILHESLQYYDSDSTKMA